MFKILQVGLQHYLIREFPNVQAGFRKGRGARDKITNIHLIIEKAREFQKNIYLCFIDYTKAFDCTIALISHASKVMFKILQDRLQQYVD